MKLLKIKVRGLPLFNDELCIDFYAQQRVTEESKNSELHHLFSNIYLNNAIAFIGLNASGKTTTLNVLSFIISMLNNKPINIIKSSDIFNELIVDQTVHFEVFFYHDSGMLNKLEAVVKKVVDYDSLNGKLVFDSEKLWSKSCKSIKSKKDLFLFDEEEPEMVRDKNEEFLLEDVSIMIAYNKKNSDATKNPIRLIDMLVFTNINVFSAFENIPEVVVSFFDASIEYIKCKDENGVKAYLLKFKDKDKEIEIKNPFDLNNYLSSGTIKGISVFMNAIKSFKYGGYLIIDELENHFNKEIVATLIRFFTNNEINIAGSTLIYSSHYPELLDEFDRNDNIYITRNQLGIIADNLSTMLKRNDVKKSEVYESGYLSGTVPTYESYITLKKAITTGMAKAMGERI